MPIGAVERQAHRMARATRELGGGLVKLKLERCGIKLSQADELEIARVHQTLTLVMADIVRATAALGSVAAETSYAVQILNEAYTSVRAARPFALCGACRHKHVACDACHGRGWVTERQYTRWSVG